MLPGLSRTPVSKALLFNCEKCPQTLQTRPNTTSNIGASCPIQPGRLAITVSLETLTSSSALKSPPMLPFCPGAVGTGTAFPPADSSKTRGKGAAIIVLVVISNPAPPMKYKVCPSASKVATIPYGFQEICHTGEERQCMSETHEYDIFLPSVAFFSALISLSQCLRWFAKSPASFSMCSFLALDVAMKVLSFNCQLCFTCTAFSSCEAAKGFVGKMSLCQKGEDRQPGARMLQ